MFIAYGDCDNHGRLGITKRLGLVGTVGLEQDTSLVRTTGANPSLRSAQQRDVRQLLDATERVGTVELVQQLLECGSFVSGPRDELILSTAELLELFVEEGQIQGVDPLPKRYRGIPPPLR